MGREIKFRAWDGSQMLTMPLLNMYGLSRFFGILSDGTPIMQYTGLKDKNGKDIYEGDIVNEFRITRTYPAGRIIKKLITWDDDMTLDDSYGETAVGFNVFAGELEVIGNIHQNPDLL